MVSFFSPKEGACLPDRSAYSSSHWRDWVPWRPSSLTLNCGTEERLGFEGIGPKSTARSVRLTPWPSRLIWPIWLPSQRGSCEKHSLQPHQQGRRRQDTGRVGIARQTQSSLDQYRGPGKTRAPGKPCRRPAALFEYFVSSTGAAREDASPAEKVAPRLRGNSWIKCGDNATVESKICVKD